MRALIGTMSMVYGLLGSLVLAFWIFRIGKRLQLAMLMTPAHEVFGYAAVGIVFLVSALLLCNGGAALVVGRQWSLKLVNRSATAMTLSIFAYLALRTLLDVVNATDVGRARQVMHQWNLGLMAVVVPLVIVWWTGRHVHDPIDQLSWTWRQNNRRAKVMWGSCGQCGAMLNFATGQGTAAPSDEPFKLYCAVCGRELTLGDVQPE